MQINIFDDTVMPYLSSKEIANILSISKSIREKSKYIFIDSNEDFSKSWATEIISDTNKIDNILRK